jgi:hypothetical protein
MSRMFEKRFKDKVFHLSEKDMEAAALTLFLWQAQNNPIFARWLNLLRLAPTAISKLEAIPFMPVGFFKTHQVVSGGKAPEFSFETSGSTGSLPGYHHVVDLNLYRQSAINGFEQVWGPLSEWCFLALLPGYIERPNASLVYMIQTFMEQSGHPDNGYFLHDFERLSTTIQRLQRQKAKVMLLGVTFALLDFSELHPADFSGITLIETGGMKGKRQELVREEVHQKLQKAFNLSKVGSEYGMTELLSQAWSLGGGLFRCPPWMRVFVADPNDPLAPVKRTGKGAICVLDLCNIYSCAFLATQDVGEVFPDGSFEILGRFDHAELRGCNLMAL